MRKVFSVRVAPIIVGITMLLVLTIGCGETKTIEVPGETVIVEKEVVKEVQVPGETIVVEKEVIKTVEGPERIVVKEVPGVTKVITQTDRYANNIWGELVEMPQYGGSIAMPLEKDDGSFDPWHSDSLKHHSLVLEKPFHIDWSLSPGVHDWAMAGYPTASTISEGLAESWEMPDGLTTIFNIREGAKWQNTDPMNGREFDAYDVEFTYHRNLGLGDFAETGPSTKLPYIGNVSQVESVEATDKWTIEVKASEFSFNTFDMLGFYSMGISQMVPPEVIKNNGDMKDWRTMVGTGPFGLSDYVADSHYTYEKNPDYWKHDPRHPELKLSLPYVDQVKMYIMPDMTTRLAATRTGKLTWLGGLSRPTIDQVNSIKRTNPDLVVRSVAGAPPGQPAFRVDRPPFDDINVRVAMQKALNLEEVSRVYYSGYADKNPWGIAAAGATGYVKPFANWSEDTKWKYEYDPAAAEKLLDDAGYPRGADGIRFTTGYDVITPWGSDVDVIQIAVSYWDAIGVNVELNVLSDAGVGWDRMKAMEYDGITHCGCRHKNLDPVNALNGRFHSVNGWVGPDGPQGASVYGTIDPVFDAYIDETNSSDDRVERGKLFIKADMYHVEQMWSLNYPPVVNALNLHQQWLKGFRGEMGSSEDYWWEPIMYMWVDQDMKTKMGH